MRKVWFLSLIFILASCTPTRFIKPLEKGQKQVQASLGGPLIGFAGTTIPMPFTTVSAGYGVNNRLTGFGTLHTTAALFGVAQIDLGVLYGFTKPNGYLPGISGGLATNLAITNKKNSFRCWPQLNLNAYWDLRKNKDYCYINFSSWVDLSKKRYLEEPQLNHFLPSLALGYVFSKKSWSYMFEYRRIDPFQSNQNIVVDYKWSGTHGATGLYFSVAKTLKGKKS